MGKIFCPYCGEELNDNENFCHFCGEKVSVYIDDLEKEDIEKLNDEIKEIESEIFSKSKNDIKNEFDSEDASLKNDNDTKEKPVKDESNLNKNELKKNVKVLKKEKIQNKNAISSNNFESNNIFTTKNMLSLLLIAVLFSGGMITQNLFSVKKGSPVVKPSEEKENALKNIAENENVTMVSEGYVIVFDESEKAYYVVGVDGSVKKKIESVKNGKMSAFKDGYAVIDDNIYDENLELVLNISDYNELNYVGDGLVSVVDKSLMHGIYDLNNKKYVLEPNSAIKDVKYLDENMFLVTMNDNKYIYNLDTNNMYDAKEYDGKLAGVYKDGYIVYKDGDVVYLVDKNASKSLVATVSENDKTGQYSDDLLFIKNSFYDKNGNKIIDLKNEKITNTPVFVNGYALIIIDGKYFTVIEKETGAYLFDAKLFEYVDNDTKEVKTTGIYKGQDNLSKSGFLLVKINNDKEEFALMDNNGDIKVHLPFDSKIKSALSDDGYVSYLYNDELYIISTDGKDVKIILKSDIIDVDNEEEIDEGSKLDNDEQDNKLDNSEVAEDNELNNDLESVEN